MFKLAPLFGEGAVLCRGKEIRIFGTADEGAHLAATLTAANGTCLAEAACVAAHGRFLLQLPPQSAQTGCTLTITDGVRSAVSTAVAIGEVYLAAGQSNMELALWNADEGQTCIQAHDDPELRYFNVPQKSVWDADAIQAEAASHWQRIQPGSGGDMSAVAYFFARKLRQRLGVPVGIIGCYWGGTSITAWLDEETLRQSAEGLRYMADDAARSAGKTMAQWQAEQASFEAEMADWNGKVAETKAERPGIPWAEVERVCGVCPWHPPVGPGSPYRPGGLAETMTKRIAPAALTGVLYYQGESDAGLTCHYDLLLTDYIRLMRRLFRDDTLPFLNVQLPVYGGEGWGDIRRAQALVAKQVAHTGLVCLIDCGERDNIHPTDKRTPGERLFEAARTLVYGEGGVASPQATGKYTVGSTLTVTLDAPVALTREGDECAEIAGVDGVWHTASLAVEGDKLHLTSPVVPHPVSARYAYATWCRVRLFGQNGLPLAPFVLA